LERHPLLNRELVEFMLQLPWEHKRSPSSDRVAQRRALVGVLPELVRAREEKGNAEAAFLYGLRLNWNRIQPLIKVPRLAECGFVDPSEFERVCRLMRHGVVQEGSSFTMQIAVLALERWLSLGGLEQGAHLRRSLLTVAPVPKLERRSVNA
jgi:asparagine synthase (glutamine-hydrolysing)